MNRENKSAFHRILACGVNVPVYILTTYFAINLVRRIGLYGDYVFYGIVIIFALVMYLTVDWICRWPKWVLVTFGTSGWLLMLVTFGYFMTLYGN